ncbi:pimeloyl-ACP methyl ester carboxylesterase [Mycoplasmopsis mustelae]|uniref:Pimeloyl-ACP methyl ester carboxylesterase n=1 Tax=Mycoplasmopsis mustelae TaxID=171289 RepID=A0A4R7UD36_9BACT|nr:alpha/beta hydrolase [Mycoplasmopsis mustelae]TDV24378.1 pimeloyl-ACP methyl ester carboxylesterase [Mycoplasmopsis mustelae]
MKQIKYQYPYVFKDNKQPINPIIFIHGFNSNAENHNIFMQNWNLSDYYAISFPGNNLLQPKNSDAVSVESFADLLIKFIQDNNLKDVVVIGHSMGGGIISLAYNKQPSLFAKMIYVTPMNKSSLVKKDEYFDSYFPKTFEEYKKFLQALYYNTNKLFKNKEFMKREEKNFDPYLYNNKTIVNLGKSLPNLSLMNQIEKGLNKITVPVLLLLGERDTVIDRDNCIKYFKENVKNIQIEVFNKVGHMIYYENFDKYLQIITEFYKK